MITIFMFLRAGYMLCAIQSPLTKALPKATLKLN